MIFWFSATGNSQYAAEKVAAALNEKMISIGAALRDGHYNFDISEDEYLGFVIPTYAWTLPYSVASFIDKLKLNGFKNQYVFGLFTCGASSGQAGAALYHALKAKELPYNGDFELVMPDNFIVWSNIPGEAKLNKILRSADIRLKGIIKKLLDRTDGRIDTSVPKMPYLPPEEMSTSQGAAKLHTSPLCIGCGVCEKVCPEKCIKLVNGKPVWEGKCSVCLACLHRCTLSGIEYGTDTVGKKRYTHPGVELKLENEY
jgi:ferredoxin/flavodoxin